MESGSSTSKTQKSIHANNIFDRKIWAKMYKDEDPPYIDPLDCNGIYSSIIQPNKDEEPELFFWTLQEDSTQFRVLWLGEEAARCGISAGTCEIYIP